VSVPFAAPNPASKVQVTLALSAAEIDTVIDWPESIVGLALGFTN
jgi:hypothetical protein